MKLNSEVKDWQEKGLKIYAISTDTPENNKDLKEKYNLNYEIISDPGKKVQQKTGIINSSKEDSKRGYVIINKSGKILKHQSTDTFAFELSTILKTLHLI